MASRCLLWQARFHTKKHVYSIANEAGLTKIYVSRLFLFLITGSIMDSENKEINTPLSFSKLRYSNVERQHEWDSDNQISLSYRGNELAGETGEACNIIKKLERERLGIKGSRANKEHLAEELADIIICVDLIAMHEGIDLEKAVRNKFNATSKKVGLKTRLK
jgi:NTP pyrophosphatase (non-canonical NTP hydrolase)